MAFFSKFSIVHTWCIWSKNSFLIQTNINDFYIVQVKQVPIFEHFLTWNYLFKLSHVHSFTMFSMELKSKSEIRVTNVKDVREDFDFYFNFWPQKHPFTHLKCKMSNGIRKKSWGAFQSSCPITRNTPIFDHCLAKSTFWGPSSAKHNNAFFLFQWKWRI